MTAIIRVSAVPPQVAIDWRRGSVLCAVCFALLSGLHWKLWPPIQQESETTAQSTVTTNPVPADPGDVSPTLPQPTPTKPEKQIIRHSDGSITIEATPASPKTEGSAGSTAAQPTIPLSAYSPSGGQYSVSSSSRACSYDARTAYTGGFLNSGWRPAPQPSYVWSWYWAWSPQSCCWVQVRCCVPCPQPQRPVVVCRQYR